MTATLEIPIFPLGTVLFPQGRLPLRIFEVRYVDMTKACIRDDSVFGVCLIREGREVGAPAIPHEVGCTARIKQWDVPSMGLFTLVTEGEQVFRILERWSDGSGLMHAQVEVLPPLPELPLPAASEPLSKLVASIVDRVGAEHFAEPLRYDDAVWVSRRLAEILPLDAPLRQQLLEERDPMRLLTQIEMAVRSSSRAPS